MIEDRLRRILFGEGLRAVRVPELAEKIGEKIPTVYAWRRHPLMMKAYQMIVVANAVGLSEEEKLSIFAIGR